MFTFGLLALSICAVWLPPIPVGKRFNVPGWLLLFVAAILSGLAAGYLTWPALPAIAFLGIVAHLARSPTARRVQRIAYGALTAVTALALALHVLPGFKNPALIANVKFSPEAAPFTQYASFDKAAAGLIILAWLCARATTAEDSKAHMAQNASRRSRHRRDRADRGARHRLLTLESETAGIAPVFLATNLFFTCVAEEAFFRGFRKNVWPLLSRAFVSAASLRSHPACCSVWRMPGEVSRTWCSPRLPGLVTPARTPR